MQTLFAGEPLSSAHMPADCPGGLTGLAKQKIMFMCSPVHSAFCIFSDSDSLV